MTVQYNCIRVLSCFSIFSHQERYGALLCFAYDIVGLLGDSFSRYHRKMV